LRRNTFILALLLLAGNALFAQQRLMVGLKGGLDFKSSKTNYVYTYRGIDQTYGINQWSTLIFQFPSPALLVKLNDRFGLEISTQFNFSREYVLTDDDDDLSFFDYWGFMSEGASMVDYGWSSRSKKIIGTFYNFELGLSPKINVIRYKRIKLGIFFGLDYSLPFVVNKEIAQPLPDMTMSSYDDEHDLGSNFAKDHLLNWRGYLSAKIGASISRGPVSLDIGWGQSLFTPEKSDNPFFRAITSFEMNLSYYFFNRPFKFQNPRKSHIEKTTVKKRFNYFSLEIFQPVFTNSTIVGPGAYFLDSTELSYGSKITSGYNISSPVGITYMLVIDEKPDYTNYIGAGIGLNQHLKNDWWLKHALKINVIKETYKNYSYYNFLDEKEIKDNIQTVIRIGLSSGVRRNILTIKSIGVELEAGLNLDFFADKLTDSRYDDFVLKRNPLNLSPYYQTCFLWKRFRFNLGYVHSLFPLFREHGGVNIKNFRNAYLSISIPFKEK